MTRVRPPWWLFALVAIASAYALPREEELNPLLETAYLALAVAAVMAAAWRGGLQVGLQVAILCALANNVLSLTRTGALGASLAQFGVFMLVALVVSARRPVGEPGNACAPAEHDQRDSGSERPTGDAYRRVFEDIADAILVADLEGRCLEANRPMAELTGYRRRELRRLRAGELLAPVRRWTAEERARFIQEGHWQGELAVRRKDGTVLTAEARLVLLELPSGAVYLTAVGRAGRAPNMGSG